MTTHDKRTDADNTADRDANRPSGAPTPPQLGLTANPDLSWDDIGVEEPTPNDLFGYPSLSWEAFHADLEAGS